MIGGLFRSSTRDIPTSRRCHHIAVIMDGNGRWAKKAHAASRRGACAWRGGAARHRARLRRSGVEYLTVFAFSSENWRRPQEEVSFLMQLFLKSLQKEIRRMHDNDMRFRVIGDLSKFGRRLVDMIREAGTLTAGNGGLNFTVAANYGGRWDILDAMSRLMAREPGRLERFTEEESPPSCR